MGLSTNSKALAALTLAFFGATAQAVPQQWLGNGHHYELITANTQITWEAAKTAAEAMTFMGFAGNLASITSAAENTFVQGIVGSASAWFGGTQAIPTNQSSWTWSDGSTWSYTNWDGVQNQPDNALGGTQHTIYYALASAVGRWHDAPSSWSGIPSAYVVEFATPVPEPGTYAMLLVGLAAVGFVAKRRAR